MLLFNDNGTAESFEYNGCDLSEIVLDNSDDCINQTSLNFVEGDSGIFYK